MFKKVHRRLTMLFTGGGLLILLTATVIYAIVSYHTMKDTAALTFENDMISFASDIERDAVISYEELSDLEKNRGYLFDICDNGSPLRITEETKTPGQRELFEKIRAACEGKYISRSSIYTEHTEFSKRLGKSEYLISHMLIPKNGSVIEVYAAVSLDTMKREFARLCLKLAAVIMGAAVVMYIFSYYFTKRLLRPVDDSRRRQTEFIAAASHEIRNPVNNIMAALDAAEKAIPPQRPELISIAKKECTRLARLTGDLLTLARSDSRSFSTDFGRADLDTIVLECYEAAMSKAVEKGIALRIKLPDENITAENIDSGRLTQVVNILLDNALSYTPSGGKVMLSLCDEGRHHVIRVSDTGCGIPDEDKERVFERFYRADPSRTDNSHFGLGLCIAKELTELHRGEISVTDSESGGAEFTVKLPM
ncbi:HAMP domain-containing sensor histidine kinase [Ruminococcus sp.]|uniref:sensor histidine kinase n=1 Tax=Ruminococcus sp. TaxID=41978 RepID=UPI0025EBEE5F|nr:HAMP domain-containing sensor histidine kinase [Ruminococcus sp.]MBQ8966023.1 HAMP domain-containing histidine kinase [Ruminococcus sp.]